METLCEMYTLSHREIDGMYFRFILRVGGKTSVYLSKDGKLKKLLDVNSPAEALRYATLHAQIMKGKVI